MVTKRADKTFRSNSSSQLCADSDRLCRQHLGRVMQKGFGERARAHRIHFTPHHAPRTTTPHTMHTALLHPTPCTPHYYTPHHAHPTTTHHTMHTPLLHTTPCTPHYYTPHHAHRTTIHHTMHTALLYTTPCTPHYYTPHHAHSTTIHHTMHTALLHPIPCTSHYYTRATLGTRRVRKRYQNGIINICKSRLEVHLANTF